MFNWFTRKPSPELVILQETNQTLVKAIEAMTLVAQTSANTMQTLMDGFKISNPPQVRVMSDAVEYEMELEKLRKDEVEAGLPSPAFQDWLVKSVDDDTDYE